MANASFSNGYALLIGVGGHDLPMTVTDATDLRDLLIDPARAAYPPGQVEWLTEDKASRKGIIEAFDRLIEHTADKPSATVLVYFSGHGGQIVGSKPAEYMLFPSGYDLEKWPKTCITGLEFTQRIRAINARKLVVFLDCCHAGGIPIVKVPGVPSVKSISPPSDFLEQLDRGSGFVVVTSSTAEEKSLAPESGKNSYFTACLLEALAGKGTKEKDGFAYIFDVLSYLDKQVPKRTGEKQHPRLKQALDLDNFRLCYYAGGGKNLRTSTVLALESLERRRDQLLKLHDEKVAVLADLQERETNEINFAYKPYWSTQIRGIEATLKDLLSKLDEIDKNIQDLEDE